MSSSTRANSKERRRCRKCPGGYQKLWTSSTSRNPNRKFWKCKDCLAFDWDDDDQGVEDQKSKQLNYAVLPTEISMLIRGELREIRQLIRDELGNRELSFIQKYAAEIIIFFLLCIIFMGLVKL